LWDRGLACEPLPGAPRWQIHDVNCFAAKFRRNSNNDNNSNSNNNSNINIINTTNNIIIN